MTTLPTDAAGERRHASVGLAAMSLRARLTALVVAGAVLAAGVVSLSAVSFVKLIDARHTILDQVSPANLAADKLQLAYVNQETGVRGYVLSGNLQFLEPYQLGVVQQQRSSAQLSKLVVNQPGLLRLVRQAEQQATVWQNQFAKPAIASVPIGNTKYASQQALLQSKTLFDAVRARFVRLDSAFATSTASAGAGLNSASALLMGVLIATLVLSVLAGIAVSRSLRLWVTAPLLRLGSDAREVAGGEIAHHISPTGPPELQRLAADLEAMRERIVNELQHVDSARSDLAARNLDLARSNVELEQFAYVASHDLREPLRKVTSFVQLLQQRYEGQLDERADLYIGFAVDGATRMQVLINDLLVFSRVGHTTERFEDVDLASGVAVALGNLGPVLDEADAEVILSALPVVRGDPVLLTAVWQNLIGNSIKFRSAERPVVTIAAVRSSNGWECSVTDNGIGIQPRFADKVFVIFQRLHSRVAYDGTGIGLALCKKIVEFHGGRIWLDVDHHPGTRLCFTLPIITEKGTP